MTHQAPRDQPQAPRGGSAPPGARARLALRRRVRRAVRLLRDDRVAASHLVYFLLSAALFMPLVGGMLYFMRDVSESQMDSAAGLEARSRDVIEKITGSAGMLDASLPPGPEDPRDWEEYGANLKVSEVGIASTENSRRLATTKIENLQQAGIAEDYTNAFLDYEEMHGALRLDERFGFQLRVEPIRTDLSVDPYGTKPLKGAHVAYVAKLTTTDYDHTSNTWEDPDAQAAREIDALLALNLGAPSGGEEGFDGTGYHPQICSLVSPQPRKHGVVIGDTAHSISGPDNDSCLAPQSKPYAQWFVDDYLFTPSGERRFDAIVFGTGVDLAKWRTYGADRFKAFVEQGGTLVFLTQLNGAGFVHQCAGQLNCLFYEDGDRAPATAADPTHQLLFAPNAIAGTFNPPVAPPAAWELCDAAHAATNEDERTSFYPVLASVGAQCTSVHLGTTTSDRFGTTAGGAVLLVALDLAGTSDQDVAALFGNLLSYGILSPAYLVYGPELPLDSPIRVAQRVMALELPNGNHISVNVKLFLWRHW